MIKTRSLWLPVLLLTSMAGVLRSSASPPFQPLDLTPAPVGAPTSIVDEPLGARSSLGLTLWHMGHDPEKISEFHKFLQARNLKPATLLPAKTTAPASTRRILLEPEHLPKEMMTGWLAQGEYLASGATDVGPQVNIPLKIERAGVYRGWVRFYGWTTGTAVTSLRVYRAGREADGPIINDEIYDYAVAKEGLNWKSFMVDLAPGDYSVQLGHVTRWWHAGTGPGAIRGAR